jgi:hypothetical protein
MIHSFREEALMIGIGRSALAAAAFGLCGLIACSDTTGLSTTSPSAVTLASGSGGGGTIPQVAGDWIGQYHYDFAFGMPADISHAALMTLAEDASGNLTGRFCLGVVSPGCFPLKGKAQNDGWRRLARARPAP